MSKNTDIRFIGFNKYTRKEIKENTYKRWVMNGENNDNYKYIIDRYNGSTTNKAICNAYADLIYGRGLSIKGVPDDSPQTKQLLSIIKKKELKAVAIDFQVFNELSLMIHRDKKKKLYSIEQIEKSNVIPSIADEDGKIRSYWYSADWSKQYQTKYKPVEYPALGFADDFDYQLPEIYVARPYAIGQEYFGLPDYSACLQYAEIEEEISNYYISHIKNGLSFGTVINVPNSKFWPQEEKDAYVEEVKNKLAGSSNAGKYVVAFMAGELPTTLENVQNNDAHKQWDFLTNEASMKIISGHKCMSPMLVGLGNATGFSSAADEMDMMEQQLMKRIIAPKQDFILDSIQEIFDYFGLNFGDIYFRPLTEIEGEDEEVTKVNEEVVMAKKKTELEIFLECGEDEDLENYDIIDECEVDYEEEDKIEFVSTGTARPNAKSSQDGEDFIVRYRYVGNKSPEREFCKHMMSANKVYRKEDIMQLDNKVVNPGWGPRGANTYSIWLYKGGGDCHHKWNRVIYLKKGKNVDVNSPLSQIISTSEARRRGMKIETNDTLVSVEPRNMTNRGFLEPR